MLRLLSEQWGLNKGLPYWVYSLFTPRGTRQFDLGAALGTARWARVAWAGCLGVGAGVGCLV